MVLNRLVAPDAAPKMLVAEVGLAVVSVYSAGWPKHIAPCTCSFVVSTWAVIYVAAGTFDIEAARIRASLRPGSVFFATPGLLRATVSAEHEIYALAVDEHRTSGDGIQPFATSLHRRVPERDRRAWLELMADMVHRAKLGTVTTSQVSALKDRFASYVWLRDNAGACELLSATLRAMETDRERRRSLAGIAAEFGYTRGHLNDLMRDFTGLPLSVWMNGIRMATARRLLATSDEPVGSVADEAGFESPGYFARAFRASNGVTPQVWRQAHRPDDSRSARFATNITALGW